MFDTSSRAESLIRAFEAHIRAADFPCVGAKSALAHHDLSLHVAGDLRCPRDDGAIHGWLLDFARAYRAAPGPFHSLAVIFDMAEPLSEDAFEAAMWARVQALEDRDAAAGNRYDPRVSRDTGDPHFSLSFGGEAFFLVGLHPNASRPARRFERPVLVFNPHDQFERLRAADRYEPLRRSIIARDIALAGSANPMLARHGEISEARQYSGRMVGDDWTCPFKDGHDDL